MIVDERYEALSQIGLLIEEVHFSKLPKYHDLYPFLENGSMRVYLPLNKQASMDEFSKYSEYIYGAHFYTDMFCDYDLVHMYGNLRHLILYCSTDAKYFDQRDIDSMQNAIVNLTELESFKFILISQSETLTAQLSERFIFPCSKFTYEFDVSDKRIKF